MRNFFIALTRNGISLTGAAITTASAVLMATLFAFELVGAPGNPYVGILSYLILPAFLLLGLLLIPVGIIRQRRRRRREDLTDDPRFFPVLDLNVDRTRRLLVTFVAMTVINVIILATATYKGVEVMESAEFCGSTCHVMEPERTAYADSPHTRVRCVECHIGPGAGWFVKSKMSGAWQVVSTTFDLYERPIPTPIHNLRPARETCEQCHWPSKFVGDRLKVITHFESNEENSELKTVLLLRVGGVQGRDSQGIHWHVDPENQVRFRADKSREKIYEIELTTRDAGAQHYYPNGKKPEADPDSDAESEWRLMDCVDCHNRPTHIYRMPEQAVDTAIQLGSIDRELPFIRRQGLAALQGEYGSHEEAREGIKEAIGAYYRENHPDLFESKQREIWAAANELGNVYSRNVFPAMAVSWGTYPDHIGHQNSDGCFRCHDDLFENADGEVISQDCDTCHTLLALEEEDPEILGLLKP